MEREGLRELEHLVLLAISRLDAPTHGLPIVKELRASVRRSVDRASVYVVLRRLEARGYVTSELGEATPQRGGRAKRMYSLTPAAIRALKSAQRDFVTLWAGSKVLLLLVMFGLITGAGVHAQSTTRPNLTGRWLNLSDPNATSVEVAKDLPNALLTITQQGDSIAISRSWNGGAINDSFVCDGRENKNGYSQVVERTRCRWDAEQNGTLVIEGTVGDAAGNVVGRLKHRYWLDPSGVMHVERFRHITQSMVNSRPRTYTQQYRRVTSSR